ncbi:diguanylate cyclase [Pseudomonas sp.]|uniref:GGDEF domain-containing protein n=1 Tax=Pseudomonas sp. TaxID=306 RepID=UPI003CC60A77
MSVTSSLDRPGSRVQNAVAPEPEHAIVEWLLHDDQVMRECFRHAVAILKTALGTAYSAVILLDAEHQHYRAEAGVVMAHIPRERSLADHVVRQPDVFMVEDARQDPRFVDCQLVSGAPFVRLYAGIALRAPGGGLIGALCAMDPRPGHLQPEQLDVLRHLRAMIENDLALRTATAIDPLTQLFNRRFMLESVQRKWQETPAGQGIAAVMIDIDYFKQYNDTYGHPAGDDCLRQVAAVIQAVADQYHLVAGRLGGEEFGLLVAGHQQPQLREALEALRHGIWALNIEHRRSSFYRVTVSIGAAQVTNASSPREGFSIADQALYQAKAQGRNQVVIG